MTRILLPLLIAVFATSVRAEVPFVATDIPPVHSLVARVMQGVGTPDLIIRAGASPHSYSLRPSEATALERADLVVWIGPGLTPWMGKSLQTLAGNARQIALMEIDATLQLPARDAAIFDEQTDNHSDGLIDPHGWLDPMNGRAWLGVIARELATLDPDNAEIYMSNAAAGIGEIDTVMNEAIDKLEPMKDVPFVVFHDAFQYFEARFALSPIAAIFAGDARTPGPARIAAIQELMQANRIACLVTEPQFDPGFADLVLNETDAKLVEIDPLGTDLEHGPGLYTALIDRMAAGLAGCI